MVWFVLATWPSLIYMRKLFCIFTFKMKGMNYVMFICVKKLVARQIHTQFGTIHFNDEKLIFE